MLSYLLLGIVIWFLVKAYVSVRDARRRARDLFGQFGAGAGRQPSAERKGGWSRNPAVKRKKIDSSVGEYVAFEEIARTTTTTDTSGETTTTTEVEQQITDVEWEEIK